MHGKRIVGLILVCILAGTLRFGLIPFRKCIETDGFWYVSVARRLLAGESVAGVFPPGYPLLILPARQIVSDWEMAARVTSAFFGVLMVAPLFLLCRDIFGERSAWCAASVASVYPALVGHSTQAMSEMPYTCFYLCALLCCYRGWRRARPSWWACSGGLFGYSFLIRPEVFVCLPLGAILALWPFRFVKARFRRRLAGAFLFCSLFLLIPFPYWLHIHSVRGEWRLTMKRTCAMSYAMVTGARHVGLARDKLYEQYDYKLPTLTEAFLEHPWVMVQAFVINTHVTHKHVVPALFPPFALALLVVGITYPRVGRRSLPGELFLAGVSAAYVPVLFFEVGPRIFLPLAALTLVWIGRGVVVVGEWVRTAVSALLNPVSGRTWTICAAVLSALVLMPFTLRPVYRPDERGIYKDVGLWMRDHLDPPLRVAHRKPWIAFYAGAEHVTPPLGSYEKAIDFCRRNKTTHLVVDSGVMQELRPSLRFLVQGSDVPRELTFVTSFEDELQTRVVVYELNAKETERPKP